MNDGPSPTKVEASYARALRLWIFRFQEAQRVIRDLESENERLRARIKELEPRDHA